MKPTLFTATAIAALALGAGIASAHITLETREAAVGTTYKAVFRVSHGCGGEPTTAVRIRIPEGVIGVKPMPKVGWSLAKVHSAYAQSHDLHGSPVSEGVTEVAWSGGNLPDDEYDEFVLRASLSTDLAPNTMLYFPVVQECAAGGVERWIEIPEPGESPDDYETPAPGLKLLP